MKNRMWLIICMFFSVTLNAKIVDIDDAISNEDWSKAIELITPLAEEGEMFEQYRLGILYGSEYYGHFNQGKSVYWYKLAASHKVTNRNKAIISQAQYELLRAYEEGQGVDKDSLLAYYWATKSARNGHLEAMSKLADFYFSSEADAAPVNIEQSYKWYKVFLHFSKEKLKSGKFDWDGQKEYLSKIIPATENLVSNLALISDREKLAVDVAYVPSCIEDVSKCR